MDGYCGFPLVEQACPNRDNHREVVEAPTEALLAVQAKDQDTAREALLNLTDAELIELQGAASDLSRLCFVVQQSRQIRTRR
jgi:hypothetical protein